ncbi:MAG: hypothetical protein ACRDRJ_16660 [Streptosporangiaceae bacterium]
MRSEFSSEPDLPGSRGAAEMVKGVPEEWSDGWGDASGSFKAEHRPDVSDGQTVHYGLWDAAEDDGWRDSSGDSQPEYARDTTDYQSALKPEEISQRTSRNRIDLADNVPAISLKPTYDGYLDVVIHGNESETAAVIDGREISTSLDEVTALIENSPSWDHRPIRLMSCSTGKGMLAQDLANRIGAPVYAPSDLLGVRDDGSTFVQYPGSWRRFEPQPK